MTLVFRVLFIPVHFDNMSQIAVKLVDALSTSTSQKQTYNTLLSIYSEVITNEDGLKYLKNSDGLERVIEFLSKPNEKILNISLGILANCCVDEDCRKKIVSGGTMKHLASIMKFINQDKIHYRCCKLIGNLARYSDLCSVLIHGNVCNLLSPILRGSPSINTQFVALRCLRYICIGTSPSNRKAILQSEVLKCSLQYLNSENKDVQKMVLRILFYISRSRSVTMLKQLITEDVLKQIISLTPEYSSFTLRIVYCLSEISYFHFKLVKAGVLEEIFSHVRGMSLKDLEPTIEMNMNFVLCSICRLSHEPKCRERICCIPEAFDTLMDIIENSTYLKFKKYCVLILTSYIYYSEDILRKLVEQRLISALITYLRIIVDKQGVAHSNDDSKVDSVLPSGSPLSSGQMSPMSDSELSNSFSGSPLSEGFPTSPALSVDSVYSPVCSPSMDGFDDDNSEDESEKLSVGESSRADSPLTLQEDDIAKCCPEEKIFNLLKQLSFTSKPVFDLCAQRTWETLLEYLVLVRKNSTLLKLLLSSIAGNKYFFHALFKSQFALTVHRKLCRPVHNDCNWCQEMERCGTEILTRYRMIAESSFGDLIVLNELKNRNTTTTSKTLLSVTIPHIVRNVNRLEEYLIRDKILYILIDSLKEEDMQSEKLSFEEKAASLNALAKTLFIEHRRVLCTLCKKCDVASQTKEGTITFLLDDDSTVTANKSLICEKSEFFEAMFRCGFKEANESVVRLSNISSDCLRILIRLLYSYCDCILPKNIIVMLELIVQCDRFLIPALSDKLLNITMNHMLDYKNGHIVYDWAVESGSFLVRCDSWQICQNVIKYTLVGDMSHSQRVHLLKMLLRSQYKDDVLRDIYLMMEKQLTCKEVKMKSSTEYIWEGTAKRRKLV